MPVSATRAGLFERSGFDLPSYRWIYGKLVLSRVQDRLSKLLADTTGGAIIDECEIREAVGQPILFVIVG